LEVGGWKREVGGRRMEVGRFGSWRLEVGSRKLENLNFISIDKNLYLKS
jgi:hypothetical protein